MAKQILFDDQARAKLQAGIATLSRTVGVTLGPAGRNVILEKSFGGPVVTKDGVTVAKEIEVKDPFENIGVKLVRQVASKTNDEAGDGTTTATLLAAEMVAERLPKEFVQTTLTGWWTTCLEILPAKERLRGRY